MKQTILFSLAFLWYSIGNAQFSIGIASGVSVARSSFNDLDPDFNIQSVNGIPISFIMEAHLGKSVRLQSGFTAIKKGLSFKYSGTGYSETETFNFNYVEIPLNVKVYFTNKKVGVYGIGGPFLGVISSGQYKYNEKDGTSTSQESYRFKPKEEGFETLDAGFRIGAGIQLSNPWGSIFLSPIYHIGFTNMLEDKQYIIRNNALVFHLGYLYTFKKSTKK